MESQLRCIRTLAHKGSSPTFSLDGKTLISFSSVDKTANVWNVNTGELKNTFSGLQNFAFSPDGKSLASRYSDNTIKLWDVQTGELKHSLTEHPSGIIFIGFSPDSKTLVTRDKENIKLWNTCTGELINTIVQAFKEASGSGYIGITENVVFSPNGQSLAISSTGPRGQNQFYKNTSLWDIETGQEIANLDNKFGSLAFSHDGKIIFISCTEERQEGVSHAAGFDTYSYQVRYIQVWDLITGQTKTLDSNRFCALSPDGQFVVGAQTSFDGSRASESINIIDLGTGEKIKSFPRGTAAELSPNGKVLAVSEQSQLLKLIDWHSGTSITTLSGIIRSFAFSHDGSILAVSNGDTIKLWQESTEPILKQQLHGNAYPHLKRLENFLARELWDDADRETADVIKNFPSQDLNVVDELWVHYSNGYYGFSVQKQIWERALKDYNAYETFTIWVGWATTGYRHNYHGSNDEYVTSDWDTSQKGYYPRAVGIRPAEIFSRLGS